MFATPLWLAAFAALGISVGDFQIAGGLILFILAAKDLVQSAAEPEKLPEDFGVVPLGMPLIAGPASITTLLVLAQNQAIGLVVTLVALAANLLLVVLALHYSEWLGRKVGATGMRAISKIIAMLLAAIDQASVAPAVALIGADLGNSAFLSWIVSAYFVTATAVTTLYGKIADIHGRRLTLYAAVAIFLAGSLVSAAAPDIATLIAGRAIQGLGGGGLLVLAMTVIGDVVPPAERGRYAAYISGAWAIASIAGPVMGGAMAEHVHWRAIFLVSLPLGALAIGICSAPLQRLAWQRRDHRLDILGAVLAVATTVLTMLALTWSGPRTGWTSPTTLGLLVAAALVSVRP